MKKNRIGIITIHSVYNYGAMLQAFALQKYLSDQKNNHAEVIDYRPYYITRNYSFVLKDLFLDPRNALGALYQSITKARQFKNFNFFLKNYLIKSRRIYTNSKQLKDHDYNILISGSDQIWNPFITGKDEAFLFEYEKKKEINKLAYSSSFGVSSIDNDWSRVIKKNLASFKKIGVREDTGSKIITNLLPKAELQSVLDPVFLIEKEYWSAIAKNSLDPKEKYILVYCLEPNDKLIEVAKKLSYSSGIRLYAIHPFASSFDFVDECINTAGPLEFISLIRNAEFIITNSFHGTAFSIIMEKSFFCIPHSSTGSRMTSLLNRLGINDQDIDRLKPYSTNKDSKKVLNNLINHSKNFLKL